MNTATELRTLDAIARDALACESLKGQTRFYAEGYLVPLTSLTSINDMYVTETARDIVNRALNELSSWRGEDARRIKLELNAHLKGAN